MKAAIVTIMLGAILVSAPAWSQHGTGPFTASGEIKIPSQQQLEREAFMEPRGDFPSIDATIDDRMDRMNREIDRLVERGICDGC